MNFWFFLTYSSVTCSIAAFSASQPFSASNPPRAALEKSSFYKNRKRPAFAGRLLFFSASFPLARFLDVLGNFLEVLLQELQVLLSIANSQSAEQLSNQRIEFHFHLIFLRSKNLFLLSRLSTKTAHGIASLNLLHKQILQSLTRITCRLLLIIQQLKRNCLLFQSNAAIRKNWLIAISAFVHGKLDCADFIGIVQNILQSTDLDSLIPSLLIITNSSNSLIFNSIAKTGHALLFSPIYIIVSEHYPCAIIKCYSFDICCEQSFIVNTDIRLTVGIVDLKFFAVNYNSLLTRVRNPTLIGTAGRIELPTPFLFRLILGFQISIVGMIVVQLRISAEFKLEIIPTFEYHNGIIFSIINTLRLFTDLAGHKQLLKRTFANFRSKSNQIHLISVPPTPFNRETFRCTNHAINRLQIGRMHARTFVQLSDDSIFSHKTTISVRNENVCCHAGNAGFNNGLAVIVILDINQIVQRILKLLDMLLDPPEVFLADTNLVEVDIVLLAEFIPHIKLS